MAGQGICMHGVSLSQNCDYCDSDRGMDKHRKDRREPVQPYKCPEHKFQTLYRDVMINHLNRMHNRPSQASAHKIDKFLRKAEKKKRFLKFW